MQRQLGGCAFCENGPEARFGDARTWGQDDRVSHPICVDCAIQETADPDVDGYHACDDCGLVVDVLSALTRFHVTVGHLEGTVRLCSRCCPGGPATYWTRELDEHVVE